MVEVIPYSILTTGLQLIPKRVTRNEDWDIHTTWTFRGVCLILALTQDSRRSWHFWEKQVSRNRWHNLHSVNNEFGDAFSDVKTVKDYSNSLLFFVLWRSLIYVSVGVLNALSITLPKHIFFNFLQPANHFSQHHPQWNRYPLTIT